MNNQRIDTNSVDRYYRSCFTLKILIQVTNFRSLTDSINHQWKKFVFWLIVSIHQLNIFFLLTTIDLSEVFCRHRLSVSIQSMFFWPSVPNYVTAIEMAGKILNRVSDYPGSGQSVLYKLLYYLNWIFIQNLNDQIIDEKSQYNYQVWSPINLIVRNGFALFKRK